MPLEEQLHRGLLEEVEMDLLASKMELDTWVSREETRVAQQAKQAWIEKREADSKFFRIMASKNLKAVKEMRINDEILLKTPEEVHLGAVDYFKNFLASNHCVSLPDLTDLIEKVV